MSKEDREEIAALRDTVGILVTIIDLFIRWLPQDVREMTSTKELKNELGRIVIRMQREKRELWE